MNSSANASSDDRNLQLDVSVAAKKAILERRVTESQHVS